MQNKDLLIKKSLRYSIFDGAFYSVMVGFGESFFTPFAVFLQAGNLELGLLGSLPQAMGSLSQFYSNSLLKLFKSRKRLVSTLAFAGALMHIPIILVYFMGKMKIYMLILFICIYWILNMILGPAWNSWMGDLVPENSRGAYFGQRNRIAGFVSFVSFMLAGFILQQFAGNQNIRFAGFTILFTVAMLSRAVCYIFLIKKYEPPRVIHDHHEFGFGSFLKQAAHNNYGLFVFYLCFMNFSVFISAPFFAPYMLKDLSLSYQAYTLVIASAIIIKVITLRVWGILADKHGTRQVIAVTGYVMPFVPLLWVFSWKLWYLIVIQAFSGFVWGGFEIASFNYIFDATSPEKRQTCVAYLNILIGVSMFAGAMAGAAAVHFNRFFWTSYFLVFILSFVLRLTASVFFIPRLKELRSVEHISYRGLLLKAISAMPSRGLIYGLSSFRRHR
ncbi:MAG: MFS transporter [bacterium]